MSLYHYLKLKCNCKFYFMVAKQSHSHKNLSSMPNPRVLAGEQKTRLPTWIWPTWFQPPNVLQKLANCTGNGFATLAITFFHKVSPPPPQKKKKPNPAPSAFYNARIIKFLFSYGLFCPPTLIWSFRSWYASGFFSIARTADSIRKTQVGWLYLLILNLIKREL